MKFAESGIYKEAGSSLNNQQHEVERIAFSAIHSDFAPATCHFELSMAQTVCVFSVPI